VQNFIKLSAAVYELSIVLTEKKKQTKNLGTAMKAILSSLPRAVKIRRFIVFLLYCCFHGTSLWYISIFIRPITDNSNAIRHAVGQDSETKSTDQYLINSCTQMANAADRELNNFKIIYFTA